MCRRWVLCTVTGRRSRGRGAGGEEGEGEGVGGFKTHHPLSQLMGPPNARGSTRVFLLLPCSQVEALALASVVCALKGLDDSAGRFLGARTLSVSGITSSLPDRFECALILHVAGAGAGGRGGAGGITGSRSGAGEPRQRSRRESTLLDAVRPGDPGGKAGLLERALWRRRTVCVPAGSPLYPPRVRTVHCTGRLLAALLSLHCLRLLSGSRE